jgi:hypothetical protein
MKGHVELLSGPEKIQELGIMNNSDVKYDGTISHELGVA